MTQQAVTELCELMKPHVWEEADSRRRADAIVSFACSVSEEVLKRAGITKDLPGWRFYLLAIASDQLAERPEDYVGASNPSGQGRLLMSLNLYSVPSDLSVYRGPGVAHTLIFCCDRVLFWDSPHDRPFCSKSYEDAARFVIFWLAEKILQIIRKNNWDRVSELPDLFDRLMAFEVA